MQLLACALLVELGASLDGVECGELAAFCVHPSYRGSGRGDSLLDYVEQRARDKGIRRLVCFCSVRAAAIMLLCLKNWSLHPRSSRLSGSLISPLRTTPNWATGKG